MIKKSVFNLLCVYRSALVGRIDSFQFPRPVLCYICPNDRSIIWVIPLYFLGKIIVRRNNEELQAAARKSLPDDIVNMLVSKTVAYNAESSVRTSKDLTKPFIVVIQDRLVLYLLPFFSSDNHNSTA